MSARFGGGVSARCVWVSRLKVSLIVLVVVHGASRLTSLTTVGAIGGTIGAVYKLLLRE